MSWTSSRALACEVFSFTCPHPFFLLRCPLTHLETQAGFQNCKIRRYSPTFPGSTSAACSTGLFTCWGPQEEFMAPTGLQQTLYSCFVDLSRCDYFPESHCQALLHAVPWTNCIQPLKSLIVQDCPRLPKSRLSILSSNLAFAHHLPLSGDSTRLSECPGVPGACLRARHPWPLSFPPVTVTLL